MRTILQLSETGGAGGAETICLQLARELTRHGDRVVGAVPSRGWLFDHLMESGIRCATVSISRKTGGHFDWPLLRDLITVIRSERVDLVHCHCFGMSVYASIAGRITGVPVISTLHGDPDLARTRSLRRLKFRLLDRLAACIVTVSNTLREKLLRETPVRSSRTRVIHNGIESTNSSVYDRQALLASLGMPVDTFVIGAVGNIRPSKAYDVLLRAAAILCASVPRARFIIVGDVQDKLYDELSSLQEELGLGDLARFVGFREDALSLMHCFDVFALSSRDEGFSLALLQALDAGLPAVATRCGGPEDILRDGVDGLLVPRDDPEALAAALHLLYLDEEERLRLAAHGRQMARRRFSLDRMVNAYRDLYSEVLNDGMTVQDLSATASRRTGTALASGTDGK